MTPEKRYSVLVELTISAEVLKFKNCGLYSALVVLLLQSRDNNTTCSFSSAPQKWIYCNVLETYSAKIEGTLDFCSDIGRCCWLFWSSFQLISFKHHFGDIRQANNHCFVFPTHHSREQCASSESHCWGPVLLASKWLTSWVFTTPLPKRKDLKLGKGSVAENSSVVAS